jgi:hypothetical protein
MALLDLSSTGFNSWVRRGLLPPPCAGTPADEPRWSWAEITAWMHGDRSSAPRDLLGQARPVIAGKKRGPRPGEGGRPRRSVGRNAASTAAIEGRTFNV